jgi:hypothetical protein
MAARNILARSLNHATLPATAQHLLAVLDDPKQTAKHAEAIRALGVVLDAARRNGDEDSRELTAKLAGKFDHIITEGPQDLLAPSLVAAGVMSSPKEAEMWIRTEGDQVTKELKDRVREVAKNGQLDAAAKEVLGKDMQIKTE